MRLCCFYLLCISSLFSQTPKESPQIVQEQLNEAQIQYEKAKKIFNPWYTGPLVTPSATMMPPGCGNVQPYLFVNGSYAEFNKNRESKSLKNNQYSLEALATLFTGITKSVDFNITVSGQGIWQGSISSGGFNDISAVVGFLITPESLYVPAMKFTLGETFPTGKYQDLNPSKKGLDASGEGSFQTQFGFAISKVIWWLYEHPLNTRFFISYNVPDHVEVHGVNAFGGDPKTVGHVSIGRTLTTDLGLEMSFNQNWVGALDVVYVSQSRTRFWGYTTTPVGSDYNDNLSLAPAIEYNWNENLGVIAGVQFSVYGRNSMNFAKGQFSVSYTW